MKKQFVLAAVVLATAFSFVSCGDKKPETTEPETTEVAADTTAATVDTTAAPAADTTAAAADTTATK